MDLRFFYLFISGFLITIGSFCSVFGVAEKSTLKKWILISTGLICWGIVAILLIAKIVQY
ncbi:hypothetical protein ABZU09_05605 [Lactobacillus mulieris]|jgi:hypothetical protein|uniref:Uncharacterized protein n=1 Tax=Lactobacillus mulieris TaxID=2508708 RepID=A0AAP3M4A5_9LACO|nr:MULTISPECIES: hypothetical protein [Lactobacillus]EEU21783.1 hypothetical protein HMPREF0525_00717 [Lactobacillus jensenii 27-2-CHN]EEX24653.1 hypothetical protein HMPREF0974_00458 [Lactobacillus jensenii 115-3-CHN]EFH29772.1 hypothetical protein HMPREF0526_11375 [Lactobacillus jensenii JV-V16]KAA9243705.1 hypothetical protein F6I33_06070 [Lactobacillus jensenii]KAA9368196.1 hypothetical protein F6I25_04285 [Lactobacillus jensenii]